MKVYLFLYTTTQLFQVVWLLLNNDDNLLYISVLLSYHRFYEIQIRKKKEEDICLHIFKVGIFLVQKKKQNTFAIHVYLQCGLSILIVTTHKYVQINLTKKTTSQRIINNFRLYLRTKTLVSTLSTSPIHLLFLSINL